MNEPNNVDTGTCWYSDAVTESMNRFLDENRGNPEVEAHFRHFVNLLALVPKPVNDSLVLVDVGCGTGYLQEFCKGWQYVGVDLPNIIRGCLKRNYPDMVYEVELDFVKDELPDKLFISYNVTVINGVLDIMQYPLPFLSKILLASSDHLIIHRQEITEEGKTRSKKFPSYNSYAYHSIINRNDFNETVEALGFEIVKEERLECGFPWENGGSSFLLKRK